MINKLSSRSILFAIILLVFLIFTIFFTWFQYKDDLGSKMVSDIARLAAIMKKIDATAGILNFDFDKNPINFLTIKKGGFVGSEVGALNLKHAKRWDGPYLPVTPTIEGQEYIVLKNKNGLYVTLADGVNLPNKKQIGKDIILDYNANVEDLIRDPNGLSYKGQPLAIKIIE